MKKVDPNDFRLGFIRLDKKQKNDPADLKRMLKMFGVQPLIRAMAG